MSTSIIENEDYFNKCMKQNNTSIYNKYIEQVKRTGFLKPKELTFKRTVFEVKKKNEKVIKAALQAEADRLKNEFLDYDFINVTAAPVDVFGSCTYTLIFKLRT